MIISSMKTYGAQVNPIADVKCESFIVIDANTGSCIYSKNENERLYPASLTKILTSLILIKNKKPDDMITANKTASLQIPSSINLKNGESITAKDCLYAMLLLSANDAAYAAAENIAGNNIENLLNSEANKIGLKNSHFVTPNGLFDKNHYTTAKDMAILTKEAIKYDEFNKAVYTKKYTLDRSNEPKTIQNINKMLYKGYSYTILGGKTGYTKEAENCLIEIAQKKETKIILVMLKSPGNTLYGDADKILSYTFSNYSSKKVLSTKNISYIYNNSIFLIKPQRELWVSSLEYNPDKDKLSKKIIMNEKISGKKDEIVGKYVLYINNKPLKSVNLLFQSSIDMNRPKTKYILIFICIIGVIIFLFMQRRKKIKNCR